MQTRIITLIAVLLILSVCASAQAPSLYEDWRWTSFGTMSGLPSDRVYSIVENPSVPTGSIWARTQSGIAWFDGYQWHPVPLGRGSSGDSIVIASGGPAVPGIIVILHDTVFTCTKDTAVAIYSPAHEAVPFPQGGILIHSDSILIRYSNGSILAFPLPPAPAVERSPNGDLFRAASGTVWMNRADGLYRLDGLSWKMFLQSPTHPLAINCIAEDTTGAGYISIAGPAAMRGLWSWEHHGTPARVPHDEGDRLQSIDLLPGQGSFSLALSGNLYARSLAEWRRLDPLPPLARHATGITYRPSGDLWVATGNGLALFNGHNRWWSFHPQPPPSHNRVHEIMIRRNGEIWMGTADGVVIEDRSGKSRFIGSIDGTPIPDITGVAEDTTGAVWISSGSSFDGAYMMDRSGKWRHVSIGEKQDWARFHRIKRDGNGDLWFLGIPLTAQKERGSGPGVYKYNYSSFQHLGRREGLISGYVYAFTSGSDGSLWFGTSIGLACRKNGRWLAWRGGTEIPLRNVFALAMDSSGSVWMADRSHGIVRLDQQGNLRHFTQRDGLCDDRVWEITVDPKGDIWAATANGLSRCHDTVWTSYDERTGLKTPALWPVLIAGDTLLAGTLGSGLGILNLAALAPVQAVTPRVISGGPTHTEEGLTLMWTPLGWWGTPRPDAILTRYRVDEGDWSPWSTTHAADLNDVPSGNRHITIQARNIFGEYASAGTVVAFSVPPPFYLQPAFLGGVVAFLIAVWWTVRKKRTPN